MSLFGSKDVLCWQLGTVFSFFAVFLPEVGFAQSSEWANGPVRQVSVSTNQELRKALANAEPGDDIVLMPGQYSGGLTLKRSGEHGRPIRIRGISADLRPVITGGYEGFKASQVRYVVLQDLVFEGAAENGVNIDDGGTAGNPTRFLLLRGIVIRGSGTTGNQDGLKMSGVDDFVLENCQFEAWAANGQGVDLVGCHHGYVNGCVFDGKSKSPLGFQAKGGSSDLAIESCRFKGITWRSLQIGGTTGKSFFRPVFTGVEASKIIVRSCTFCGGEAAISFVNMDQSLVEGNIFFNQTGWIFRILQESQSPDYPPCQRGEIRRNVVVWRSEALSTFVNVGAGTAPETFLFESNAWYCEDRPQRSKPAGLPVLERGGIYGVNPQLQVRAGCQIESQVAWDDLISQGERKAFIGAASRIAAGFALTVALVLAAYWHRGLRRYYRGWESMVVKQGGGSDVRACPQRWHVAIGAVSWFVFVGLACLYPFNSVSIEPTSIWAQFVSPPWGGELYRRTEWIALCLAFIPGGILLSAYAGLDRKSWRNPLAGIGAVVVAMVFATAIELLQGAFPFRDRIVSRNDVAAMSIGAFIGWFIWVCIGQICVNCVRRVSRHLRPLQLFDILLWGAVGSLFVGSLAPFEVIIQPRQLYDKFNSGLVQVTPFLEGDVDAWALMAFAIACIPVGLLACSAGTTPSVPLRQSGVAVFLGAGFVVFLEFCQLFIRTRYCNATQVVAGVGGVLLGVLLSQWILRNSPIFSPAPTAIASLNRLRRRVHLGIMVCVACLFVFNLYWWY